MKIAVIVISGFIFFIVPQYGWADDCSPVQISFTRSFQLVPGHKDVCGLRLNLPAGDNCNMTGIDFGFLGSAVESKGIALNLIGNFRSFSDSQDGSGAKGIQIGGLGNFQFVSNMQGLQLASLINLNSGDTDGIQLAGFFNGGGHVRGIQISGLFNVATSVRGIQIGLFNITQKLSGLQIGLVNYIRESPVPILPIINLKF